MYRVEYFERVVKEDIPRISIFNRKQIMKAIETRLMHDPISFGKPLQFSLKGCRRIRVGDYRVIYKIESDNLVLIVKIGHRKDVYDG